MLKVKIVYGTVGGNTELVCEKIYEVLKKAGHEVLLLQARSTTGADVGDYDVLVLACPTYGQGELEYYFNKFLHSCGDLDFKGKKCCVIGLGDVRYGVDHTLASERIITEFLKKKEADIFIRSLKIANSPILYLNSLITTWAEELVNALK